MSGYDEDGIWDRAELLRMQKARRHALEVKFANVDLNKLLIGDRTRGLKYWLDQFGIRVRSTDHLICDLVVTFNKSCSLHGRT